MQCPFCNEPCVHDESLDSNFSRYDCPNCGKYLLDESMKTQSLDEEKKALISHYIWNNQDAQSPVRMDSKLLGKVRARYELPDMGKQLENALLYLIQNSKEIGTTVSFEFSHMRAKLGVQRARAVRPLLEELETQSLVNLTSHKTGTTCKLTFRGWKYAERLASSTEDSTSKKSEESIVRVTRNRAPAQKDPKVLFGNWTKGNRIGSGGQGGVFDAKRPDDDETYAAKVVRFNKSTKKERFLREAANLLRLSESNAVNVVRIIDHNGREVRDGAEEGIIIMPKAVWTLDQRLNQLKGEIELVLGIFRQIVLGVAEAHKLNIVHRDLKPSNILSMHDAWDQIVVADFGICYIPPSDDDDDITRPDEAVGPRYFIAPEFEVGKSEQVTRAADIYSLGKLLHHMLTGRRFAREEVHKAFNDDELGRDTRFTLIREEVLRTTVLKEPGERIPNASKLLEVLDSLDSGQGRGSVPGYKTSVSGPGTLFHDLKEAYKRAEELIESNNLIGIKRMFDECKRRFTDIWPEQKRRIVDSKLSDAESCKVVLDELPQLTGLIVAIARFDFSDALGEFRQFSDWIIVGEETWKDEFIPNAIPQLLVTYSLMSLSTVALHTESWRVLQWIFSQKFTARDGRETISCHAFDDMFLFPSESGNGRKSVLHDHFRERMGSTELCELHQISPGVVEEAYEQVSMLMTLRCETENASSMYYEFSSTKIESCINMIERVREDAGYGRGIANLFAETPQEWVRQIKGRVNALGQRSTNYRRYALMIVPELTKRGF